MNVKKALAYPAIAGILVASLAACSDDNEDKVSDAAGQATSAAADAGASATSGAGDAAASGTGEAGKDGENGSDSGEMKEIQGPNGAVQVPAAVADKYEELGGESSHLGAPKGEPQKVGEGQRQDFDGGSIFVDPEGKAFLVQGKILERYEEQGGPESQLGWPTADEATQEGGWISTFQNGNITFVNGEYGE
ncbi:LGFP repeat-containing protein [Dietzia sp.]|uniref:LGFP repeat-containing protein n=1 Tax=Dietzia sp. TaxID=1871616 RepID=UPI002FD93B14